MKREVDWIVFIKLYRQFECIGESKTHMKMR